MIQRGPKIEKQCSYAPTRTHSIQGQIMKSTLGEAFLSDDYSILLRLKKKIKICGCEETYTTNFEGILVRYTSNCGVMPISNLLPPSSMNLRKDMNIKLDYSMWKSNNLSQALYESVFSDVLTTLKSSMKNFLSTARKAKIGVFEIQRPLYGTLRGEILG